MHEEIANRIDIRRIFKTSKQVMEEAYENILKYRRGELIPAKPDTIILMRLCLEVFFLSMLLL